MAAWKENFEDEFEDRAKKSAKKYAKKKVKRMNGFTLFFCILALAGGMAFGVWGYGFICADDCFEVVGEKEYVIELGAPEFTFNDRGAKVIEFGRDISDKVKVETNMTELGDGKYTADTTVPGKYYIKYTVDSPKYGNICRIRTFTITENGGQG